MSMFQEFKTFIARGNVLDLAVGVIIGGAFGTIVTSLTSDLIMPLVSAVTGTADFSENFIRLGAIPAEFAGNPGSYAALKEAGIATLGYGAFITALINFLILAFAVFLIVKNANRFFRTLEPEAAPAAPPEDVLLLREIRDSLKK
ncbi:MAG: large conductance mechanosensitive channel protein MscL [Sandarakinorhabdus sp.]|nr:large conductance mechanosensitive channel protein MscL [Sandarakinorhabdus sp.]